MRKCRYTPRNTTDAPVAVIHTLMNIVLLSLFMFGSVAAGQPAPPGISAPELGARMSAAGEGVAFRVRWKIAPRSQAAETSELHQNFRKSIEDSPDGGTFPDPLDHQTLVTVARGLFLTKGTGFFRKESWLTGVRSTADTPKVVELWTPETLCELDGVKSDRGLIYKLSLVPPLEQLKARRAHLSTYEEQRADLGYITNAHYVGQLLTGLSDISVESRADGLLVVSSPSFKFHATVDPRDGRLINDSFANPIGKDQILIKEHAYGGWYGTEIAGIAHPGWERITYTSGGDPSTTSVILYDAPERLTDVSEDTFDWRTTAESVFDMNNKNVLHADGSRSPQVARVPVSIPIGDAVEVSPQGLLRPKNPETPNRYVWAVGITLIAAGAALWIRNRFMTRK